MARSAMASQPTKEHIVEMASRLVHRQGFNHTSLDQILRESGVRKGNFYYYFRSKEELGYAVLDRFARQFAEQVTGRAFTPEREPLEQLSALLEALLEAQRQAGCAGG